MGGALLELYSAYLDGFRVKFTVCWMSHRLTAFIISGSGSLQQDLVTVAGGAVSAGNPTIPKSYAAGANGASPSKHHSRISPEASASHPCPARTWSVGRDMHKAMCAWFIARGLKSSVLQQLSLVAVLPTVVLYFDWDMIWQSRFCWVCSLCWRLSWLFAICKRLYTKLATPRIQNQLQRC